MAVKGQTKAAAAAFVATLHACALVAFTLEQREPEPEGGQAPVINLTLEPAPRFDAATPPAAASSAAAPTPVAAASPSAPLRLRQAIRAPADISLAALPMPAEPAISRPPVTAIPGPPTPPAPRPSTAPLASTASDAGATQGGGGRILGAAATSSEDLYLARVIAWIETNKRAPAGAGTGVVTVRFVLDRRGGVRDVRLIRSGGSRLLDQAALDQIRVTQPFPRPDAGADWRTREFTLNIDYRRP